MARSRDVKTQVSQKEIVNRYFKGRLVQDLFKFSNDGSNNIRVECTKLACDMFAELKEKCGVTENDIQGYLKQVTAKLLLENTPKENEF